MDDDFFFLFDHRNDRSTPMSEAYWWYLLDNNQKWQHIEDSKTNGMTQKQVDLVYRIYDEEETIFDEEG